jgi:hypothetical protein
MAGCTPWASSVVATAYRTSCSRTPGAFRTGAHDDLVTGLGLATLDEQSGQPVGYGPDLGTL